MNNEKEISFGAFDSELMHQEIFIPEGFEATIDGDKIILKKIESEDEKIRKFLIKWIQDNYYNGTTEIPTKTLIAWLEKQGEHKKFRDSIQVGDEVTRNRDGVIVNLSQLKRVAKKDEKQSETFTKKDVDDAYVEGMAFAKNELEKQGEQKSVGEEIVEALRTEYEKGRADAFSLMQKEWSEEDEEMFEYTINLLNYNLGCRKWLQSLKERHIWKPSDAQIRALEYIINNASNTSYSCKIANGLLEQLKKLKGE